MTDWTLDSVWDDFDKASTRKESISENHDDYVRIETYELNKIIPG